MLDRLIPVFESWIQWALHRADPNSSAVRRSGRTFPDASSPCSTRSRARTTSAADKWSGGRSSARSSSSDRDGGYRGCAVRPERAPDPPEVEPDPLGLVLPPLRDRAPALDPPPERGRPLV